MSTAEATQTSPTSTRKWLRLIALLGGVGFAASLGLYAAACTAMGASAEGERLTRMQSSPQWGDGHFVNVRPAVQGSMTEMTERWISGGSDDSVPRTPIEPLSRKRSDYDKAPSSGLRVTWLGHSSLLVEIDGARVLVDPVWGERPSPLSFAGPKRWYAPPLPLDEVPDVDAVIISHDHYDHLDYPTVTALLERNFRWVVPLGVGAHLAYWGVPDDNVVELDWWETEKIGELTLTATPARHFSGRTFPEQGGGPTLWAGWTLKGPQHNVYYSGDTALFDALVDIGKKLGPFDLTMIESGAYNAMWADVHLGPEQAVRAHQLVGGKVMMPVHWGLFDLAMHGWTEPIERVVVEAKRKGVNLLSLRPGEMAEPSVPKKVERWWPELPWDTVEQHPAWSSGVEHLRAD